MMNPPARHPRVPSRGIRRFAPIFVLAFALAGFAANRVSAGGEPAGLARFEKAVLATMYSLSGGALRSPSGIPEGALTPGEPFANVFPRSAAPDGPENPVVYCWIDNRPEAEAYGPDGLPFLLGPRPPYAHPVTAAVSLQEAIGHAADLAEQSGKPAFVLLFPSFLPEMLREFTNGSAGGDNAPGYEGPIQLKPGVFVIGVPVESRLPAIRTSAEGPAVNAANLFGAPRPLASVLMEGGGSLETAADEWTDAAIAEAANGFGGRFREAAAEALRDAIGGEIDSLLGDGEERFARFVEEVFFAANAEAAGLAIDAGFPQPAPAAAPETGGLASRRLRGMVENKAEHTLIQWLNGTDSEDGTPLPAEAGNRFAAKAASFLRTNREALRSGLISEFRAAESPPDSRHRVNARNLLQNQVLNPAGRRLDLEIEQPGLPQVLTFNAAETALTTAGPAIRLATGLYEEAMIPAAFEAFRERFGQANPELPQSAENAIFGATGIASILGAMREAGGPLSNHLEQAVPNRAAAVFAAGTAGGAFRRMNERLNRPLAELDPAYFRMLETAGNRIFGAIASQTRNFAGMMNCMITHAPGASGPGILVDGAAFIGVSNRIENNRAARPAEGFNLPGEGRSGGGIAVRGALPAAFIGNTLRNNRAEENGGGAYTAESYGTVWNGNVFEGNTAERGGGFHTGAESEGYWINNTLRGNSAQQAGGGAFAESRAALLEGNRFHANESELDGGGLAAAGGAQIRDNTMTLNRAGARGGGLAVLGGASPVVEGNTLAGNYARTAGGGAAVLGEGAHPVIRDGNRFLDNIADGPGGGLFVDGLSLPSILHNRFAGNISPASGGGLYWSADGTAPESRVAFLGNLFEDNTAGLDGGGALLRGFNAAPERNQFIRNRAGNAGGGLHLAGAERFALERNDFFENQAFGGGGFWISDADRIEAEGNVWSLNRAESNGGGLGAESIEVLILNGDAFGANRAGGLGGGAWLGSIAETGIGDSSFNGNQAASGGGLFGNRSDNMTVSNSAFHANTAFQAGQSHNLAGLGGAMSLTDSENIRLSAVRFTENQSSNHGAGLYLGSVNRFLAVESRFERNHTGWDENGSPDASGGALRAANSGDLTLGTPGQGNEWTGNTAARGGAIALSDCAAPVTLQANRFEGNHAGLGDGGGLGGAVLLEGATTRAEIGGESLENAGNTFVSNTAGDPFPDVSRNANGGAVAVTGQANAGIHHNTFKGNAASFTGGAVYLTNTSPDGSSGITGNAAEGNGVLTRPAVPAGVDIPEIPAAPARALGPVPFTVTAGERTSNTFSITASDAGDENAINSVPPGAVRITAMLAAPGGAEAIPEQTILYFRPGEAFVFNDGFLSTDYLFAGGETQFTIQADGSPSGIIENGTETIRPSAEYQLWISARPLESQDGRTGAMPAPPFDLAPLVFDGIGGGGGPMVPPARLVSDWIGGVSDPFVFNANAGDIVNVSLTVLAAGGEEATLFLRTYGNGDSPLHSGVVAAAADYPASEPVYAGDFSFEAPIDGVYRTAVSTILDTTRPVRVLYSLRVTINDEFEFSDISALETIPPAPRLSPKPASTAPGLSWLPMVFWPSGETGPARYGPAASLPGDSRLGLPPFPWRPDWNPVAYAVKYTEPERSAPPIAQLPSVDYAEDMKTIKTFRGGWLGIANAPNVAIHGNTVNANYAEAFGGGVFLTQLGAASELSANTFTENHSICGGAAAVFTGSPGIIGNQFGTFGRPNAARFGGALYLEDCHSLVGEAGLDGSASEEANHFEGNIAGFRIVSNIIEPAISTLFQPAPVRSPREGYGAAGGAIAIVGGEPRIYGNQFRLNSVSIESESFKSVQKGPYQLGGGAIAISGGSGAAVIESYLEDNQIRPVNLDASDRIQIRMRGGAVLVDDSLFPAPADMPSATVTLENNWLHNNKIEFELTSEDGESESNSEILMAGGSIALNRGARAVIRGCTVDESEIARDASQGTLLPPKRAEARGGMISAEDGSKLVLTENFLFRGRLAVFDETADALGAGISIDNATLEMERNWLADTRTGGSGGALHLRDAHGFARLNTIAEAFAVENGSGVFVELTNPHPDPAREPLRFEFSENIVNAFGSEDSTAVHFAESGANPFLRPAGALIEVPTPVALSAPVRLASNTVDAAIGAAYGGRFADVTGNHGNIEETIVFAGPEQFRYGIGMFARSARNAGNHGPAGWNPFGLSTAGPARTLHVPRDYATIAAALAEAKAGDSVLIQSGTYAEAIRVPAGVRVRSASGPLHTTLIPPNGASGTAGVNGLGADNRSLASGLTLRGFATGVLAAAESGLTIANLIVDGTSTATGVELIAGPRPRGRTYQPWIAENTIHKVQTGIRAEFEPGGDSTRAVDFAHLPFPVPDFHDPGAPAWIHHNAVLEIQTGIAIGTARPPDRPPGRTPFAHNNVYSSESGEEPAHWTGLADLTGLQHNLSADPVFEPGTFEPRLESPLRSLVRPGGRRIGALDSPFRKLEPCDLNRNGVFNDEDVLILAALARFELSVILLPADLQDAKVLFFHADWNRDGRLNEEDARLASLVILGGLELDATPLGRDFLELAGNGGQGE